MRGGEEGQEDEEWDTRRVRRVPVATDRGPAAED